MRTTTEIRTSIREKGSASIELLEEIDAAISEAPGSVELWLLRGDAIQLGGDDRGEIIHPLEEAERSYREALRLAPSSVEATEALGHFLWAVMDDGEAAEPYFIYALANGAGAEVARALAELRAERTDA